MKRTAFAMQLKPGVRDEYQKRHDEIWPELVSALEAAGIRDYGIYLDPRTDALYASQKLTEHNTSAQLPELEVMRRWWDYMADLMETNPDGSPVVYPLDEMFYMD
ncbi:MAG: L-rhamnose mutarotase [Alkalispirochaeta sp.]